ncbi:MAG TPA: dTMP kinase [Candidatus Paceibacterota bacterium]|nr:dTMP kinase [Candidatus Paceibacterota bacterium]
MQTKKPLFITFEGCSGVGKTTQSKLFYDWFIQNCGEAILTREPGGVDVSEKIREIVLNPNLKISNRTELLLFEAARAQFVEFLLKPSLKENKSVICDRFFDSTIAYQGYGKAINLKIVDQLNNFSSLNIHPDLTFIINVNEEYLKNFCNNNYEKNRFNLENFGFHRLVAEGFRRVAKNNLDRCVLINYESGIDKVQSRIRYEFSKRYL